MARFKNFYKKIGALRDKYPHIFISAFASNNLTTLNELSDICDNKLFYSSEEKIVLLSAISAKQFSKDQLSPPNGERILKGVDAQFHQLVKHKTAKILEKEIFPGLKEWVLNQRDIQNEKEMLKRIDEIYSLWRKQKRYAAFSALALEEMSAKLIGLKEYGKVLASDLAHELPEAFKVELNDLAEEFRRLMVVAFSELMQAMLARLALVPPDKRQLIVTEYDKSLLVDECFNENVMLAILQALKAVGLDAAYVKKFNRLTQKSSTLTTERVIKFHDFIQTHGNDEQKKQRDSLFEAPYRLPDELIGFSATKISQSFKVSLGRIVVQEQDGLIARQADIVKCYQYLRECLPLETTYVRILKLFEEAGIEELKAILDKRYYPLFFSLTNPCNVPIISQVSNSDSIVEIATDQEVNFFHLTQVQLIEVLNEAAALFSQYKNGDFNEDEMMHTRQGRAEHLLDIVQETIGIVRKNEEKSDYFDAYANLISVLFLHYASIDDTHSELSMYLENSLIKMLGVPRTKELYSVYERVYRARAAEGKLSRAWHQFYLFAQTCLSEDAAPGVFSNKEMDLVFCFLKSLIIDHFPPIRDILFVASAEDGQGQYIYAEEAALTLEKLKDKDKQETRIFSGKAVVKADFVGRK